MHIPERRNYSAAFNDYLPTLREIIEKYPNASILELGGGRLPSFTLDQLPDNVATYTVNDIDPAELEKTSDEYEKACFDATGDVSRFAGQFDVVFSRTLIEHVSDGFKMHQNIVKLLKPGGTAFHMAPTLYAAPFVINKWFPEAISRKLLYLFFPKRKAEQSKFPAYYSWCYGNRGKMTEMFRRAGFSKVKIRTFYGHSYFRKIPIVRSIDGALSAFAAKRDIDRLGSFAHFITVR